MELLLEGLLRSLEGSEANFLEVAFGRIPYGNFHTNATSKSRPPSRNFLNHPPRTSEKSLQVLFQSRGWLEVCLITIFFLLWSKLSTRRRSGGSRGPKLQKFFIESLQDRFSLDTHPQKTHPPKQTGEIKVSTSTVAVLFSKMALTGKRVAMVDMVLLVFPEFLYPP